MTYYDSTFILRPENYSAITFVTNDPDNPASNGYYANATSLNFNETEREQIIYSEGIGATGAAIAKAQPLVDIVFDCLVTADSRTQLISRAQALKQALTDPDGGLLEYNPEKAASRSTFYVYLSSPAPPLTQTLQGLWDGQTATNGKYILEFEITLRTLPVAISDPDSLVSITPTDRTTLDSSDTGSLNNWLTIDGDDIEGDLPAALRIKLDNLQSASGTELARVYLMVRSALKSPTLTNFDFIYEAEDATELSPTGAWSDVVDASRSGGDYKRLNPETGQNGIDFALRFSPSNEVDHRGSCSIFAMVKANSGAYLDYHMKARYRLTGGGTIESDSGNVPEYANVWHLAYVGELQFPPLGISPASTISPSIEVVFNRKSGQTGDSIDIDFFALVFSDESVAQFDISPAFDENQALLNELLRTHKSIATVINDSTLAVEGPVIRHLGSPALMVPNKDTRIYTIFEREAGVEALINEDWSNYQNVYFAFIAGFDDEETITDETSHPSEWFIGNPKDSSLASDIFNAGGTLDEAVGQQKDQQVIALVAQPVSSGYGQVSTILPTLSNAELAGTFDGNDFVVFGFTASGDIDLTGGTTGPLSIDIWLYSSSNPNDYALIEDQEMELPSPGQHKLVVKRSDFTINALGNFTWGAIYEVVVKVVAGGGTEASLTLTLDYTRIEKADPADANNPDPTGGNWDFTPKGVYGIYEDAGYGYASNLIAKTFNINDYYAIHSTTPTDDFRAYIAIATPASPKTSVGIVFRVSDISGGSEDYYFCDGRGALYKLVAGSQTGLVTSVNPPSFNDERVYWLGIECVGTSIKTYMAINDPIGGGSKSDRLAALLTQQYLVASTTDASHSSGQIGFKDAAAAGIIEFYVEGVGGGHVPADQVSVDIDALMRTIYPFP